MLALITLLAIAVGGTGLFMKYQSIRSAHIEKQKERVASNIHEQATRFIKPEYFRNPAIGQEYFQKFFDYIQSPSIVRLKVWDHNFTIIWSNLPELIGQSFPDNDEVAEAFEGEIAFEIEKQKNEHISERQFMELSEMYIPFADAKGEVVGVLEVYQPTTKLQNEINTEFKKSVWLPALFGFIVYLDPA